MNSRPTGPKVIATETPMMYCYRQRGPAYLRQHPPVGAPTYDRHGNTATLATKVIIYDGADQHMETGSTCAPWSTTRGRITTGMGARPYVPGLERFREANPVEGGSANDYDYCNGDPVNCNDLGGTKPKARELTPGEEATLGRLVSDCSGPDRYGADISGSASCGRFRSALAAGDLSEFGIGFTPLPAGQCPARLRSVSRIVGYGDFFRAANEAGQLRFSDALKTAGGASQVNGPQYQVGKGMENAKSSVVLRGLGKFFGVASIGLTGVDAVCTLAPGRS